MSGAFKNIVIYGVTANPLHGGHLLMAQKALDFSGADEVWLLIANDNPLKRGITPFKERFENSLKKFNKISAIEYFNERTQAEEICELDKGKIIISDYESKINTSFTADTISTLQQDFPDYKFVWAMGYENFQKQHLWEKAEVLAKLVPFIIFPRDEKGIKRNGANGFDIINESKLWQISESDLPAVTSCNQAEVNIESTKLREGIKLEEISKDGVLKIMSEGPDKCILHPKGCEPSEQLGQARAKVE